MYFKIKHIIVKLGGSMIKNRLRNKKVTDEKDFKTSNISVAILNI